MYAFIVHLFGLLWANQFIVGFTSVTVAGAVGSYYWARGAAGRRAPRGARARGRSHQTRQPS